MANLTSSREYIGAVEDPETGEYVQLDATVSAATAERLTNTYPYLSLDDSGVTQEADYPTNEDGEPLCVGKSGGQCGRVVDEPNTSCWQHSTE